MIIDKLSSPSTLIQVPFLLPLMAECYHWCHLSPHAWDHAFKNSIHLEDIDSFALKPHANATYKYISLQVRVWNYNSYFTDVIDHKTFKK